MIRFLRTCSGPRLHRRLATLLALALAPSLATAAEAKKLVIGTPGVPAVFSAVIVYVAEKEGMFKQYGADVEIRPFETGTAAARAVLAGDIDLSVSPTQLIVNQVSNANANLVGIYGLPNPDWILASVDPAKTDCKDIAGQQVGIDAVGAARSLALRGMLIGCPGVKIEDVQQVALSSTVGPAMVAGQLKFGVLHLDDVAVLETQGKKVFKLLTAKQTSPNSHYLLAVARQDRLKDNRPGFVAVVAALTAAARFMQLPENADRVAEAAAPTGHSKPVAKAALKEFLEYGLWATVDDGMDEKKIAAVIALQAKVGGILPGKEPVKVERLIDGSIWREAEKLVK